VECGQALPAACPRCGFAHEAGARFCGGCGHPIAPPAPIADRFASPDAYTPPDLAEKIRTARGAVEGERKQVTVLFADMKGSLAVRHCESALEGAQALGMLGIWKPSPKLRNRALLSRMTASIGAAEVPDYRRSSSEEQLSTEELLEFARESVNDDDRERMGKITPDIIIEQLGELLTVIR